MHYVSHYNYFNSLDRLAKSMGKKPDVSAAVAALSRFSLRDVLNDDEIVLLYQHKTTLKILKQWADSGVAPDTDTIRKNLLRRERYFVPQYVMKVNTPRYHATKKCEFLRAAFENFETPPEIARLGPEKVSEFQIFCDNEWPRYKDKPIDIFWAHVGSHFGVAINPREISYTSNREGWTVDNVTMEQILEGADKLRTHAESNRLTGYLYAPPRTIYLLTKDPKQTVSRQNAFMELLKLKKAIKMLVFNFHRIELEMPEGLLSDELLEVFGFLPCRACCGRN